MGHGEVATSVRRESFLKEEREFTGRPVHWHL